MVTETILPAALQAAEAAKYMGIARPTFDRVAVAAKIPAIHLGNRRVYRIATLDAFLASQESQSQVSGASS